MKVSLGLGLILASLFTVSSAPLPEECKVSAFGEQALRNNPSAKVYEQAGAWFLDQNNVTCALAAIEEAVLLEPRSPQAHYDLGVVQARARQLTAAVAEFRLAIQYRPGMTIAHNSLGVALMDLGKPAEAEAEFREALRLDPNSVIALNHLAQRLAAERRYAPAIRYWKRALALQPDSPEIARAVSRAEGQEARQNAALSRETDKPADALLKAGQAALAEKRLETVIAGNPQLVAALSDLGIIRANKGDNLGAEKLFR